MFVTPIVLQFAPAIYIHIVCTRTEYEIMSLITLLLHVIGTYVRHTIANLSLSYHLIIFWYLIVHAFMKLSPLSLCPVLSFALLRKYVFDCTDFTQCTRRRWMPISHWTTLRTSQPFSGCTMALIKRIFPRAWMTFVAFELSSLICFCHHALSIQVHLPMHNTCLLLHIICAKE